VETLENEVKKHSSVLRTFRLDAELDDALTKRAASKSVGNNSLITSILKKYIEWDSFVEDLGYATIPIEMLARFVGSSDRDTILSLAKSVAKNVASSLPLWYGSADLDSLLKYMEASRKYSGAGVKHRIERRGNTIRIINYQPYNENGATWIKAFNTALVENVLGYPPKVIERGNSVETVIELNS
jgi:hypothetical protein